MKKCWRNYKWTKSLWKVICYNWTRALKPLQIRVQQNHVSVNILYLLTHSKIHSVKYCASHSMVYSCNVVLKPKSYLTCAQSQMSMALHLADQYWLSYIDVSRWKEKIGISTNVTKKCPKCFQPNPYLCENSIKDRNNINVEFPSHISKSPNSKSLLMSESC